MTTEVIIWSGFVLCFVKYRLIADSLLQFKIFTREKYNREPDGFREFAEYIFKSLRLANNKLKSKEYKEIRPIGYMLNATLWPLAIGFALIVALRWLV